MKNYIVTLISVLSLGTANASLPYRPFRITCSLDGSLAEHDEFRLQCSAPLGVGGQAVQNALAGAVSITCAPSSYLQTTETKVLAFLGTVMAEASFRCD